jgi:ActR/RegA family two-component response regulator
MPSPLKNLPILLVEDDPIQAADLADSLRDDGALVLGPVYDAGSGLTLLETHPCSGAIVDYRLARGNARPLFETCYRRRLPFIVHTGYDRVEGLGLDWPGCRVVPKPANIPDLLRTMGLLVRWQRRNLNRNLRTSSASHVGSAIQPSL